MKELAKELKVGGEKIGYRDDVIKVAVLLTQKFINKCANKNYYTKVQWLKDKGYKIKYVPSKKSEKKFKEFYDIYGDFSE